MLHVCLAKVPFSTLAASFAKKGVRGTREGANRLDTLDLDAPLGKD